MSLPTFQEVSRKVLSGDRLSLDDGVTLMKHPDLMAIGDLANTVKEMKTGNKAFYVINRQINPTNICVLTCKFCDFSAKKRDSHAYEQSMDEIVSQAEGVREVHIVGGLHPDWDFDYYLEMIRNIKAQYPSVQVKAWTAVEIDFFSKISKLPHDLILSDLKDAGLDTMPGGGAEVFSDRVHKELFKTKIGYREWLNIHEMAHSMGVRSNSTLLFGHIETPEECIEHFIKLRTLQDKTQGFFAFIPLEYQPGDWSNLRPRPVPTNLSLRMLSVSRLMLDNFDHIKSYWVMLGEDTAAAGLHFGADDMDGTIGKERIAHFANARSAEGHVRNNLDRMIVKAGRDPVERDAFYREVESHESTVKQPAVA